MTTKTTTPAFTITNESFERLCDTEYRVESLLRLKDEREFLVVCECLVASDEDLEDCEAVKVEEHDEDGNLRALEGEELETFSREWAQAICEDKITEIIGEAQARAQDDRDLAEYERRRDC